MHRSNKINLKFLLRSARKRVDPKLSPVSWITCRRTGNESASLFGNFLFYKIPIIVSNWTFKVSRYFTSSLNTPRSNLLLFTIIAHYEATVPLNFPNFLNSPITKFRLLYQIQPSTDKFHRRYHKHAARQTAHLFGSPDE